MAQKLATKQHTEPVTPTDIAVLIDGEAAAGLYKSRVVEPFEEHAKTLRKAGVKSSIVYHDDSGLEIKVNSRTVTQGFPVKQVVDNMRHFVETTARNHANGKQMYGVRVFDGALAIDAQYLEDQLESWCSAVTGTREEVSVSYKGNKESKAEAVEIGTEHAGRVSTVGYRAPEFAGEITRDDATLYVAASEQASRVTKAVGTIKDWLKARAVKDPSRTTWTPLEIGEFAVTVKTVPRHEPNYAGACDALREQISSYAGMGPTEVDGKNTFYNTNLNEPRAYVAADHVLGIIDDACSKTKLKWRQSVDICPRREPMVVLSLE